MSEAATPDVIDTAIAEARRRAAISDRDTSRSAEHYAQTVRSVCERWGLTAVRRLEGGAGTPTLAVTDVKGTPGVLKIAEPGSLDVAARVMLAADGHGYARVLAWDADVGALLTERLGDDLWHEHKMLHGQGPIIVNLLLDAWQVPLDRGQPYFGKAANLLESLDSLGKRYGAAHQTVIDHASHFARELAATERPEVVCHGDPHAANVLRRGTGWALIDPDGFVGERSYDVGVVLRDGCREITAAERATPGSGTDLLREESTRLAQLADVDPERVWRWAYVERVTTGLYLRWHGYADESASFLAAAALLDP